MRDARTVQERHSWKKLGREVKGELRKFRTCMVCGLTVGEALGDVLKPTCAEKIVRQVMES